MHDPVREASSRPFSDPAIGTILPDLRALVETACRRPECRVGAAFFREHVQVVERFALRLAPVFGADASIVAPAAILHDIAAIRDFSRVAEHHELGAAMAEEILAAHGVDAASRGRVAACIRAHVRPVAAGAEEACLSHADALAQMANPSFWLSYAREARELGFPQGRDWYASLVADRWSVLSDSVREMARPHHRRAMGACIDDLGEGACS